MTQAKRGIIGRVKEDSASRKGQMPFSIIAVLLLVLSSTSIALIYEVDSRKVDKTIPEKTLEQMKGCMDDAFGDLERIAYAAAIEAIQGSKDLNETEVQKRFIDALNASLLRSYPVLTGDIRTEVSHALCLHFLKASLQESYARNGRDLATWEGASVPAYFVIGGNITVNVSCPQGHLSRTAAIDQDIYVPLPLLLYRLDRLTKAAVPRGELESVVRYELSALAQERVLRGYGAEAKTGVRSTQAVLTEEDVVRAVNLALVLEELRYFQDSGDVQGSALEAVVPTLSVLDGPVDPADLFLRSYDEGGIDLAPIIAQTINARADAIVLKWLDYYGLIDLINFPEDALKSLKYGLTDAIDLLTGGDTDRDNMNAYISQALSDVGIQEYDYRWFCYGGPDVVVQIPAYKICFIDDVGDKVYRYFEGKYPLDLPAVDLFSSPAWGDLYRRFETETHIVAQAMRGYIEAIAIGVASHCSLPAITLSLDPQDGKNYLEEIDLQLSATFRDGSFWLKPAIQMANEVSTARDGMAQAVMDFIDQRWTELLDMNRSVTQGALQLSWTLASQLNGTVNFSPHTIAEAQNIIFNELLGDHWGSREVLQKAVRDKAAPIHQMLDRGLSQKCSGSFFLSDQIAFGISCLPGIETLTAGAVRDAVDSLRSALAAQGGAAFIPVSTGGLVLNLADGQQRVESIRADSPLLLAGDGKAGSLDVEIKEPWEYDRGNTSYPNRHVTRLQDMTTTPYLTEWGVEYHGSVAITVRAGIGDDRLIDMPCSTTIHLDGGFEVIAFSGWGLEGVSYEPTATLARDVQELLVKAWDFIVSSVQAIGGLVGQAFTFFCQLIDDLLSYATKPLELLNQLLMAAMDALKITADSFLEAVIEATSDATVALLNGTRIDLSILGIGVMVVIGPSDSAIIGAQDRIRADLSMSCLGATVLSSVRVLILPDGEKTVVGTVELGGSDWSVDLTLDPRAAVYEHQIEVRGFMGGHVLEIVAPEVERVQKVSFAMSDIPVISQALKMIPSPVPGTTFHLDAGMEMSFNVLDRRNVLINEVELNPQGKDLSREWVELFNPSDHAVDVTGWSLQTSRGQQHTETLGGTIPARGYLVHVFSGQALDNGEVKGFPVQESVALLDPKGTRVDSAPWLKDLGDDDRTWQRTFDSSSHWELRDGSGGTSNGFVLLAEENMDGLVTVIGDCFVEAFDQFVGSGLDVCSLEEVIKGALQRFEERMLDAVERTASSLKFFVKLGLDVVSGTAGAGVSMALVYDGKAVRECLRWLMDAVGEVLNDPLNPMAAASRAPVPVQTLADHVFVQVGVYVTAGAPDIIKDYVGARVTATAVIKASLRTMGLFEGNDQWQLDFGLVVTGLQGAKIKSPTGTSMGSWYDVWALRGSLRPA